MELDELIKKYESWKEHTSDEVELAYVTIFLADIKNLKRRHTVELTLNREGVQTL